MKQLDKKEYKTIELRSEEVQEVMGKVPPWILRWGITVLCVVVVGMIVGCYFFKLPDTLAAEVTLTTTTPPVNVIARATGKFDRLFIHDKQHVEQGEVLGVIQNTTNYEDVTHFAQKVQEWIGGQMDLAVLSRWMDSTTLQLGELQGVYLSFRKSVEEYLRYTTHNYYPQKMTIRKSLTAKQEEVFQRMEEEDKLAEKQADIAGSQFYRDSILYSKRVVTGENYDQALRSYLQSQQGTVGRQTAEKQREIQRIQNKEALLDLEHQYEETHSGYVRALQDITDQLLTSLKTWEHNYVLRSEIAGTVNLMGIWSPNQNVSAGEVFCIVIPDKPDNPMGKAFLPASGAGKVIQGQQVRVRLQNYPDHEFGYVLGQVNGISHIPTEEGKYFVEIVFPDGLHTNYDRQLPLSQQMLGTAEIIIQDKRLIERFIKPIQDLLQ